MFQSFLILPLIFLVACTHHSVDPYTFPITPLDEKKTAAQPATEDLIWHLRPTLHLDFSLPPTLISQKIEKRRTQEQKKAILSDFKAQGFHFIPKLQIQQILANNQIPQSKEKQKELAQKLGAKWLLVTTSADHHSDKTEWNLWHIDSNQRKLRFYIGTLNPNRDRKQALLKLQRDIPLRGFVLETRGNKHLAKTTLGYSSRIRLGQKLLFRNWQLESPNTNGTFQRKVRYAPIPSCHGKVVWVDAEDSWVETEKSCQNLVHKGMAVFVVPLEE